MLKKIRQIKQPSALNSGLATEQLKGQAAARSWFGVIINRFGLMAAVMGLSGASFAQQYGAPASGYFGASVQSYDYRDATLEDASPTTFRLQAGTELSDGLMIEAHYGVGLSEEAVTDIGGPVSLEIDSFHALYVKPYLPMNEFVHAYALAGYAEAKVKKTPRFSSADTYFKEYGPSYGVGVEVALAPSSRLSLEYVRLMDEATLDASSLGIGINLDF